MRKLHRWLAALLLLASFAPSLAAVGDETGPVYQQRSTQAGHHWQQPGQHSGQHHPGNQHHPGQVGQWRPSHAPVQQSSSFQRPYPYHLDYYRMRYGGSYAPYSGNLYGPPQVYAPSTGFFGGYNPGYGNPGYGGGHGGGVPYGTNPGQPTTYGQPGGMPAGPR